jgi:hypothetical protein
MFDFAKAVSVIGGSRNAIMVETEGVIGGEGMEEGVIYGVSRMMEEAMRSGKMGGILCPNCGVGVYWRVLEGLGGGGYLTVACLGCESIWKLAGEGGR